MQKAHHFSFHSQDVFSRSNCLKCLSKSNPLDSDQHLSSCAGMCQVVQMESVQTLSLCPRFFTIDVPQDYGCLEKALSLDCGEIIKAFLKCTGFMKTPVID